MAAPRARRGVANPALQYHTGAPWLDLLATVGGAYGPAPVERLRGHAELVEWLAHQGLSPLRPPEPTDVAVAIALREALRPVVLAAIADEPVDADALAALQPWLDRTVPPQVVVRDGRVALEPPPTTEAALAGLCRQAVEFLAGPERAHLGACADENCHMAFLDPAQRRRWCKAEVCGVRARVRAHRARAASAPSE